MGRGESASPIHSARGFPANRFQTEQAPGGAGGRLPLDWEKPKGNRETHPRCPSPLRRDTPRARAFEFPPPGFLFHSHAPRPRIINKPCTLLFRSSLLFPLEITEADGPSMQLSPWLLFWKRKHFTAS